MRALHNSKHRQRGTAIIEMALILPVLTLLLIGVVNMGLLIREHQILQNAAREGARYSSLLANRINPPAGGLTQDDVRGKIQERVHQYLLQERMNKLLSPLDASKLSCTDSTLVCVIVNQNYTYSVGGLTETASQVTVSYPDSMLIKTSLLWPFGPVTLSGQAVFRNLY